jgi:putative acetyltransferase
MFEIRAMAEADIPAVVGLRNLPGVRRGTLALPFESVERAGKFFAGLPAGGSQLVACFQGGVIGMAGLKRGTAARRAHVGSLGIMVHDDWVGKGAGTMLFGALTDIADNWLGLRRLELGVYADNAPALALYKKFGFAAETVARADALRDGVFVDSVGMARLRGGMLPDAAAPPDLPAPAPAGDFVLRAAEPGDLAGITELMNQPVVRHFTLRVPFSTAEDNRFLARPAEEVVAILAVAEGVVAGIATLRRGLRRRAHAGELDLLAVHDAYAGRGIGRALLAAVLDLADNWLGLKRIGLTAFADNAAAIGLYETFGFAREGLRRADAFRNGGFADAVAMGRVLL